MAASGNLTTDILGYFKKIISIRSTQIITFLIGGLAIVLATMMQSVLELMLYSYAFMVSGLLIPVLGSLLLKRPSSKAAFYAMIAGGSTTLVLIISKAELPFELDANFFGITAALLIFIGVQYVEKNRLKWQS
jgi:SSS family solute:Na+ symporter